MLTSRPAKVIRELAKMLHAYGVKTVYGTPNDNTNTTNNYTNDNSNNNNNNTNDNNTNNKQHIIFQMMTVTLMTINT